MDLCAICFNPLNEVSQIEVECCHKYLHTACLYQWLVINSNTKCPFCRHVFSPAFQVSLRSRYIEGEWPLPRSYRLSRFEEPLSLWKMSLTHYQLTSGRYATLFLTHELDYSYEPKAEGDHLGTLCLNLSHDEKDHLEGLVEQINKLLKDYQITSEDLTLSGIDDDILSIMESHEGQYRELLTHKHKHALPLHGTGSAEFMITVIVEPDKPPRIEYDLISGHFHPKEDQEALSSENGAILDEYYNPDDPDNPIYQPPPKLSRSGFNPMGRIS